MLYVEEDLPKPCGRQILFSRFLCIRIFIVTIQLFKTKTPLLSKSFGFK